MLEYYSSICKKQLLKNYKQYLGRMFDNEIIEEIFKNKKVISSFNELIKSFYEYSYFGNKFSPAMKQQLENYKKNLMEEFGIQDDYLRPFLDIYRFYCNETYLAVGTDKRDFKKRQAIHFNKLREVCCEAVDSLYEDLTNGNRWWETNDATCLRKQFLHDKVVLLPEHIQELCKKYLGREIDLKEMGIGQKRQTPPVELVKELDAKMDKKGFKVVNFWVDYKENGEPYIYEGEKTPPNNQYYSKRYVCKTKELEK